MHDNVKARVMGADGIYTRSFDSSARCCAQEKFIAMAYESAPPLITAPQPVQQVQPPQPPAEPQQAPAPSEPKARKKGLWARIKALFSRKK